MEQRKLKITEWAEEDRPREKMQMKGVFALSDAELIAILIGSGNKSETAVELSQRILASVNNNLNALGKLSINDLTKNFNGIGDAKAITIVAALELGRRRKHAETEQKQKIFASKNVYDIFHPILGDLSHEEAWILLLNKSNKVIKMQQVNKGGINSTLVDIRLVLKTAIENLASGIILCHNHPTNDATPSKNDDALTMKLKESASFMDITLLDHVIICDGKYYSYKDQNRI
ncbi:MAG: RadC family protein [Dysgonomonas sp.]